MIETLFTVLLPLLSAGERLSPLFLRLLNMGITASYTTLAVLVFRLLLKKAPKLYSYLLWLAVLFRLLCPFSLPSPVSILNLLSLERNQAVLEYVPADIGMRQTPQVRLGIPAASQAVSRLLPAGEPMSSVNPLQVWEVVLSALWLLGIIFFVIYTMRCEWKLWRLTRRALPCESGVYGCDRLAAPFARGLFPRGLFGSSFLESRVYLPAHLTGEERRFVLAHERVHLRRQDPLIKGLFFAALTLHWYNPFAWLAFFMMVRDMEMSCDEAVLLGDGRRGRDPVSCEEAGRYSEALLHMAAAEAGLARPSSFGPLAFGESGVSARIKNILRFRDVSHRQRQILALVCGLCLLACACNPSLSGPSMAERLDYYFHVLTSPPKERLDILWENRTPYVGDAPAVGNLLGALTVPEACSLTGDGMEIKSSPRPYELIIRYLAKAEDEAAIRREPGWMLQNMILLFALIDNVELITTRVTFPDETVLSWTVSRSKADLLRDRCGIALPEGRASLADFVAALEANASLREFVPDRWGRSSLTVRVVNADGEGVLAEAVEADEYFAKGQAVYLGLSSGLLIFDEADEPLVPGEIGEGDILHVCYGAVIQRVSPVQILDIFFITRVSQPGNAG